MPLVPSGDLVLSAPIGDDMNSCLSHIRALPLSDDNPRLFGLHPEANIACNRKEGRRLLEDVLAMQPRVTAISLDSSGSSSNSSSGSTRSNPLRPTTAAVTAAAGSVEPAGGCFNPKPEAAIASCISEMLAHLPGQLRREDASVLRDPFAALPGGRLNALGMVLLQEMDR